MTNITGCSSDLKNMHCSMHCYKASSSCIQKKTAFTCGNALQAILADNRYALSERTQTNFGIYY